MTKYEDSFILKDKVSDALLKINKNLENFNGKLKGSEVQLANFQKKTESINKLGNSITSFGQKMTVGVTLPVIGLGAAMVKSAADMESMQQQLSTMLGSELEGVKMFDEIKTMAAKTPFGTKDLMSATNTMLGFGISQEKVLPLMKQLGDISGGNADRFQSLALAFSQVSSAGKLQGQDLSQMINAGFNPLEAIAKRTGKSVGYWKDQMSKGKVSVEMVEQAMKDATSEGGRFYQMMDKQSKTALGQWSTFMDNLNNVLAEFGKIILPPAIKALQQLSKALEWLNSLSPGVKKFILVIGGIAAVIGPLAIGLGTLISSILAVNSALLTLMANPVALTIIGITAAIAAVVAVIAALVAGIILLWKNWDKIWPAMQRVFKSVVDWISTKIQQLIGFLNGLIDKLGVLAYLIPGLNAFKIGKDIGGMIAARNNSNSLRQTSIRNTTNNTTTNNNYYGNSGVNYFPASSLTNTGMNFAGA